MAQQQIITKPYVEELQDNDSLFINHDGALRQIKKSDADFASGADMRAEVAAREAFETSVEGQIAEKANVDGYYEEMTVGDAEQLVATQFVEDNEPYLFRSTGGSSDVGNRAYFDKIVGGTVAWNQLVSAMRGSGSEKGLTFTRNADGSLDISGTITEAFNYNYVPFTSTELNFKRDGRKYLLMLNKPIPYSWGISGYSATISANSIGGMWSNNEGTDWVNGLIFRAEVGTTIDIQNLRAMVIDLTQMFGSTIADYIYSLEQSQAGAGVAWFKKLFPKDYYAYNAGELLSVGGLQSHDAVGFNQWDEEWDNINVSISNGNTTPSTTTIGSKNFCPILPSTAYYATCGKTDGGSQNKYYLGLIFYDENKQYISSGYYNNLVFKTPERARFFKITTNTGTVIYGNTYNHDICINLSDPTRNGEYEPYEKHSYPLDSSLTLRGIPKLDASNNLYYDGDEYTSDGKVKRKYGIVDLGTLEWANYQSMFWYADVSDELVSSIKHNSNADIANVISIYNADNFVIINENSLRAYTSNSTAPSGLLVYELATPTTETAEPFQNIQVVDDFGTEEFVSSGFIPAGHATRYPANLRDKLQHLPDLANMDGTYLIRQSGKQMSLVHMPAIFPETPTEDGTYTLKTVVTGGVATLQWVVE